MPEKMFEKMFGGKHEDNAEQNEGTKEAATKINGALNRINEQYKNNNIESR